MMRGRSSPCAGPKALRVVAAQAAPRQPRLTPASSRAARTAASPPPGSPASTPAWPSVRADALHKATSGLAARYETVVAEDLNVAGMARNRQLARAISDQGFGQARRMLGYKTTWNGGRLIIAGRWFPSSKTCSGCGAVKAKLALSERTYHLRGVRPRPRPGRERRANLLKLAASGAESQNACGGTVRPGLAGRVPVKQEPGTAHCGSDRDRQRATGGCGTRAYPCSLIRNGYSHDAPSPLPARPRQPPHCSQPSVTARGPQPAGPARSVVTMRQQCAGQAQGGGVASTA